jgi:hypothetical protein
MSPQQLLDMLLNPPGRHVVFMMHNDAIEKIANQKEEDRLYEREFRRRVPKYMRPENLVSHVRFSILDRPIPQKKLMENKNDAAR